MPEPIRLAAVQNRYGRERLSVNLKARKNDASPPKIADTPSPAALLRTTWGASQAR